MSSPTYDTDLTVPRRFCGPPGSGNGGYTAGLLAERVQGGTAHAVSHAPGCPAVEVTLRQPPRSTSRCACSTCPPTTPAT